MTWCLVQPNDPAQARRVKDVRSDTEAPNRRCLQPAGSGIEMTLELMNPFAPLRLCVFASKTQPPDRPCSQNHAMGRVGRVPRFVMHGRSGDQTPRRKGAKTQTTGQVARCLELLSSHFPISPNDPAHRPRAGNAQNHTQHGRGARCSRRGWAAVSCMRFNSASTYQGYGVNELEFHRES
jgi:hypothetical protein